MVYFKVNDSYDKSEFLSHEPYLITDLSEPVKVK